eukprot:jgi/Psemu1/284210/fgenesh1_pg.44_\
MDHSSSSHKSTIQLLAKAWTPQLLQLENNRNSKGYERDCLVAVQRTVPLFLNDAGAASVPFVCRYRNDQVHPLSTLQVHALQSMVTKHERLRPLRTKLLGHINEPILRNRILTSTSRTELTEWYAPFQPPAKGSILERLQTQHPELVDSIDKVWKQDDSGLNPDKTVAGWTKLGPRVAVVQILGSKIASEPNVAQWVNDELKKHCRISTKVVAKKDSSSKNPPDYKKYSETYGDFSRRIVELSHHQVLAIRRGVNEQALKMAFDIDSGKMESHLLWKFRTEHKSPSTTHNEEKDLPSSSTTVPAVLLHNPLLKEAVHDAWTRLLRRRGTKKLWADHCKEAQNRACRVFQENLQRALLAPPHAGPLLALDPGFQAGIKCAILDADGSVKKLDTVRFLGSLRPTALDRLRCLLQEAQALAKSTQTVTIALGNGHGSSECRTLIQDASASEGIPVDLCLVSEAGASVWSVTEQANEEFPDHPPAAIAAISIGRRLQNPLFELVKVPPRSLGLGMYQHDLSETVLDDQLDRTSVDAVAMVGVDVNRGSVSILRHVPGLSGRLSEAIVASRPLKKRSELLAIPGLGPKTYEQCAGFVRVSNGPEALDDTLVHPESYELARWLLRELSWKLDRPVPNLPPRAEWRIAWKDPVAQAAKRFGVSEDRVLAVMENLVDSLSREDPRWKLVEKDSSSPSAGRIESCKPLLPELSDPKRLAEAIAERGGPIRGIVGTVRNVADFGAFVDIGNESDGLLHTTKLGPTLTLRNLMIGQSIGVDVLSVALDTNRISLGLHGCHLEATAPRSHLGQGSGKRGSGGTKRSASKRPAAKKRSNDSSGNPNRHKRRRTGR